MPFIFVRQLQTVKKLNLHLFTRIQFILVGKPPLILEDLEDLIKTAPDKAVLECKIEPGDPKAEITWFRKDRQVTYHNS